MLTHAILLAAGRGERMRPLTDTTPKPLLPVQGKALIEWHIERLVKANITHVVINHAWLGQQIIDYLGDGQRYGIHIQYSAESTALETASGIKKALPLLGPNPFLVISSDIWTSWDAQHAHEMATRLQQQHALAHLLLVTNPDHHPNGDFGLVGNLIQKADKLNRFTYSGIGVYTNAFFDAVPADLPTPLREPLHQAIARQQVLGSVYSGQWVDVGTPERLKQIEQNLATSR